MRLGGQKLRAIVPFIRLDVPMDIYVASQVDSTSSHDLFPRALPIHRDATFLPGRCADFPLVSRDRARTSVAQPFPGNASIAGNYRKERQVDGIATRKENGRAEKEWRTFPPVRELGDTFCQSFNSLAAPVATLW